MNFFASSKSSKTATTGDQSSTSMSMSTSTNGTGVVKNVVIAGAGPAGLLLTALLLHRNATNKNDVQYRVTLIESRQDLGELDPETDLKAHRSWMLALAGHGLEAVRTIPELYKDYISEIGVKVEKVSIFLGSKEISANTDAEEGSEGFIVDRNFVVAAISRYLRDKHKNNCLFEQRYETELLYVDHENLRVLTRSKTGKNEETYLGYDLLVGADGMRSVVREALVKRHSDTELQVCDIFQTFKAVHVTRPKVLDGNAMSILPDVFPHMQGIALPEKDGQINITIGVSRHKFDKISPELKSDDPAVVAEFLRKNLKAFPLEDYDDFAKQWMESRWNLTGMVHCNRYHSSPCKIVIMGDAAHATSPSIGMGMNTALRDAQKFHEILEAFEDDLEQVLPKFSEDRVKEGNALSDLAYYLYCSNTRQQLIETVHTLTRGFLNKFMPNWVQEHPQSMIGKPQHTLVECYQRAVAQGIIRKHRRINDEIRQEHFELSAGMLTTSSQTSFWNSPLLLLGAAALAASVYCVYRN